MKICTFFKSQIDIYVCFHFLNASTVGNCLTLNQTSIYGFYVAFLPIWLQRDFILFGKYLLYACIELYFIFRFLLQSGCYIQYYTFIIIIIHTFAFHGIYRIFFFSISHFQFHVEQFILTFNISLLEMSLSSNSKLFSVQLLNFT